jgi:hypothetical protein
VLDWCEAAERIDYVLGLPTTSMLRRHVTRLEASTAIVDGDPSRILMSS